MRSNRHPQTKIQSHFLKQKGEQYSKQISSLEVIAVIGIMHNIYNRRPVKMLSVLGIQLKCPLPCLIWKLDYLVYIFRNS